MNLFRTLIRGIRGVGTALLGISFAFGGPDNQSIYFEGATSGTFWRFKASYPGLIGPGGVRLPAQP
jgi:hypothetical protein